MNNPPAGVRPGKLWSHQVAQESSSPEAMEALSRRYGNGVLIILPLSSGRLAVFGNDRQLVDVVEYGELTQAGIEAMSAAAAARLSPRAEPARAAKQVSELSAEDMGI